MKKIYLLIAMVIGVMLLSACEPETQCYLPTSMWSLLDDYGQSTGATLAFNGNTVAVQQAGDIEDWPLGDGLWDYYLDEDSRLHFSGETEYWDSEDGYVTVTESYAFGMTLIHEETQMILSYDPVIGRTHRFYFQRLI